MAPSERDETDSQEEDKQAHEVTDIEGATAEMRGENPREDRAKHARLRLAQRDGKGLGCKEAGLCVEVG